MVSDSQWILTKNGILKKAQLLLQDLQHRQQALVAAAPWLPMPAAQSTPKISRGENYQGLPYLVLDYPRVFAKDQVLAIRTMFWWGKSFSSTLHLSGIYQDISRERIAGNFGKLQRSGYYISTGKTEWEHHFEESNYLPLAGMSREQFLLRLPAHSFLKIAGKIELSEWEQAPDRLLDQYRQLLGLIGE